MISRIPSRLLASQHSCRHFRSISFTYRSIPWHSGSNRLPKSSARLASSRGPNPRRPPQYNRFNSGAHRLYDRWQTSSGFRYGVAAFGTSCGAFYYINLERVPISGRLRFNCISAQSEESLVKGQVQQVLQQFGRRVLPPNHPYSQMVNRVLQRLILASGLEHLNWEVKVIDDPSQMNAFVMPGGKVFVFSGILPICGGEDGLATVLGHEISHQLAHHTGEKLSGMIIIVALAILASYTLDISGSLSQFALDLVLERPGSRKMESEADYMGLLMMSKACYDPNAALGLWTRMAKAEQYAPPQFLSTHPASKNRMTRIQEWLPEAHDKRIQSKCRSTIGFVDQFHKAFRDSDVGTSAFNIF